MSSFSCPAAAPRSRISRPLPFVLALWFALGVALTARTLHRPLSHTVFPVYATGSDHWWTDAPLYANYRPLDYFRYPPSFAVAFTPFVWAGPRVGGVAWAWLNLGLLLFGLRRFMRDVLPGNWTPGREAGFLVLSGAGALGGLWNGQCNALAVGLVLLAGSSLVRGCSWLAAWLLAGSVLLKLTPVPLVLLLCALWPRRLAGRFAVALAVGLLLPFLTRPLAVVIEQYRGLGTHLATSSSERWPGFRDGWTLWLVCRQVAEGKPGLPNLREPVESWYRVVQLLGGLIVLGIALWLRLSRNRGGRPAPGPWLWSVPASQTDSDGCAGAHRRTTAQPWLARQPASLPTGGDPWQARNLSTGNDLRSENGQPASLPEAIGGGTPPARRSGAVGLLTTLTLALGTGWLMLLGPAVEGPTYVFLAPFLAWAVVQAHLWPEGRWLVLVSAVLVLVLGWGSLTRPLWPAIPWLAVALPLGSGLFLTWAILSCIHLNRAVAPFDHVRRMPHAGGESAGLARPAERSSRPAWSFPGVR
jgi:Glycosyltransferase family 87